MSEILEAMHCKVLYNYISVVFVQSVLFMDSVKCEYSFQVTNVSESLDGNRIHLDEIDTRIVCVLTNPEANAAHESQLTKDVFAYYHYLSTITSSIDKENNYKLLKIVLSHPPRFIDLHYDDGRLLEAFSWNNDQLEDFNRAFEGSYFLWQRLKSMGGLK